MVTSPDMPRSSRLSEADRAQLEKNLATLDKMGEKVDGWFGKGSMTIRRQSVTLTIGFDKEINPLDGDEIVQVLLLCPSLFGPTIRRLLELDEEFSTNHFKCVKERVNPYYDADGITIYCGDHGHAPARRSHGLSGDVVVTESRPERIAYDSGAPRPRERLVDPGRRGHRGAGTGSWLRRGRSGVGVQLMEDAQACGHSGASDWDKGGAFSAWATRRCPGSSPTRRLASSVKPVGRRDMAQCSGFPNRLRWGAYTLTKALPPA